MSSSLPSWHGKNYSVQGISGAIEGRKIFKQGGKLRDGENSSKAYWQYCVPKSLPGENGGLVKCTLREGNFNNTAMNHGIQPFANAIFDKSRQVVRGTEGRIHYFKCTNMRLDRSGLTSREANHENYSTPWQEMSRPDRPVDVLGDYAVVVETVDTKGTGKKYCAIQQQTNYRSPGPNGETYTPEVNVFKKYVPTDVNAEAYRNYGMFDLIFNHMKSRKLALEIDGDTRFYNPHNKVDFDLKRDMRINIACNYFEIPLGQRCENYINIR